MKTTSTHKPTEIGAIPRDWEIKRLKQVSPRQSVGLVINPSTYFDANGTIPMLVGSNVAENCIDWRSAKRITTESNRRLAASRLAAGDLVTVRVGDPGTTAVVPPELDGCNCASMMIVRGHPSFNSTWLCHMMNSHLGRSRVEHVQYGTAQKQFNISDAIDFAYPFPPLAEQEAIAEALSDADALIESLEQLIAKKRLIKQGAMQELLTGKRRLPGFEGEWKTSTLGELCEITMGRTPPRRHSHSWGAGHVWLSIADLKSKVVDSSKDQITDIGASGISVVPAGTLLMSFKLSIGRLCFAGCDLYTNEAICAFRSLQASASYLYYALSRTDFALYGKQAVKGYTLNQQSLKAIDVRLPPVKEQEAVALLLSDIDEELDALDSKIEKARQVKQGMMHNLLTGKIRLV